MSDRATICCVHGDHINCPNFKKYGYNCSGLDNDLRRAPSGYTIYEIFKHCIKLGVNGYGPCYCNNDDKPCNCGRIMVDNKIYIGEWSDEKGWINWRVETPSIKSALKA